MPLSTVHQAIATHSHKAEQHAQALYRAHVGTQTQMYAQYTTDECTVNSQHDMNRVCADKTAP